MHLGTLTGYGLFDTSLAFPGQQRTAERTVRDFEIEYYISCTGRSVVDGEEYPLSPGLLLCAKPSQKRYSILGFSCYYVHLCLPEDSPYRELLLSLPTFSAVMEREAYERLFADLTHHLVTEGYEEDSDYVNARLLELFYRLKRDAEQNRRAFDTPDRGKFAEEAIAAIRAHYAEPISLSEMARGAGYSPNYFHHLFQKSTGKTPCRFLTEERLRHAKLLLAHSAASVAEIALSCGFSSQSYFDQTFRKETGVSPREFRRQSLCRYDAEDI